jgi:hypothetical protein
VAIKNVVFKLFCCAVYGKIGQIGKQGNKASIRINLQIIQHQYKYKFQVIGYLTLGANSLSICAISYQKIFHQPPHELELDLIMGRNPPPHPTRNF